MKRVCNKETIGSDLGCVWRDLRYPGRHNSRREIEMPPCHMGEGPYGGFVESESNP